MNWTMLNRLHEKILRAPADEGGGGNPETSDGEVESDGKVEGSGTVEGGGTVESGGRVASIERPDYIPEKFWKEETYVSDGKINFAKLAEDMAGNYRAAEQKIFTRKEDLSKEVRAEIQAEMSKPREGFPETADHYNFKPDKGMFGEGQSLGDTENDPHMQWFKQKAHDLGLTNDEFNQMANEYFGIAYSQLPDYGEEVAKLGEYGDMRVERAANWARANLSENTFALMEGLAVTAPWIEAIEEIMQMTGEPAFAMEESGDIKGEHSLDDLKAMMQDPRYWRDQDPKFVREVRMGFEKHARRAASG